MEGGELFDRIQKKGHFTERGKAVRASVHVYMYTIVFWVNSHGHLNISHYFDTHVPPNLGYKLHTFAATLAPWNVTNVHWHLRGSGQACLGYYCTCTCTCNRARIYVLYMCACTWHACARSVCHNNMLTLVIKHLSSTCTCEKCVQ